MAEFAYLALDTAGRERRGQVAASDADEARARLGQKRLYVVRVEPAAVSETGAASSRAISFGRKRLSGKQLTLFTRQLATLALVTPLEEALRTIARQSEQGSVRLVLDRVHAGVVEGRRLSEAMAREPKSFPPLYRAMVAAGEGAGTLPQILQRLADLQERQAALRAKILTALAYPAVLTFVATFVVIALMVFVVPKVVEQFDTVGQQLPFLTRLVMGTSRLLADYWWAILLGLGALAALAWRALKDEGIRLAFDSWWLRVPLIGRLARDLHAARMARTLSTMVGARLPLLEGLMLTAHTVHNRRLRRASDDLVDAIRSGGSLSGALRRTALFSTLR